MKCGIVTVYNSENCGSFLQAYALSKAIGASGHEAVFMRQNFSDHSASPKNYFKALLKAALRGNIAGVKRLIKRRAAFRHACNYLHIIDEPAIPSCFVLGSDVIWDVTSSFFKNHHAFFWGTQFRGARVVSYAASVGFAKEEHLTGCSFVEGALKSMAAVSVRDEFSKQLLQPYCTKDIQIVCDPTYLVEKTEYDAIAAPTDLKNFMLLYYYGNASADEQKAIQKLAQEEGLKTVTFGNFNTWCDMNLPYDPLLFLSLYEKANYVVTNTFHGTVFSTIYEKRFAVTKNDKPKILDVLQLCDMSDKMAQTAEDIEKVLHSEFDYDVTRQNIKKARENGLKYLTAAIEGHKDEFKK